MNATKIIRWVLTIGLLVAVYFETGPFTTMAFFLLFLACETYAVLIERIAHEH